MAESGISQILCAACDCGVDARVAALRRRFTEAVTSGTRRRLRPSLSPRDRRVQATAVAGLQRQALNPTP